jgi:hypothetical protein
MSIKTIDHKLLSTDGITVKLPEETREHFCDLIIMLDSAVSLTDFKEKIERHPYFSGIQGVEQVNLVYTAGKLKRTKTEKSKAKYRDDIYIQIAQNDLKNIEKEAGEMHASLDLIYSKIYKKVK